MDAQHAGHHPQVSDADGTGRHPELLRAIFENAVDCIITIDDHGTIESVNPAVTRQFGYSPEELIGHNVTILMPSPDREQHDQYLGRYRETGHRHIIGIGRDVLARRRDGSTFPAYLAVSEMTINGKRKFTGIVRDISDRHRYEDSLRQRATELREARDRLEIANRAKDQFLAVLSHELRTPLTPALAMLSLLEDDPLVQERLKETLQTVRRNVELEARLIDDLLDLTRVARGRLRLGMEETDAHAAVRDTLEICAADAEEKEQCLDVHLDAARHTLRADPARLRQILWNLLKNAIKFTPRGGTISVRTFNEPAVFVHDEPGSPHGLEDGLFIQVSDTGMGIEADALPRIFNAFEQASDDISRQFGGLGLGLAITRALVEMHHGIITASSQGRGRGAVFTVQLPLIASAKREQRSETKPANAGPSPLRILLVDDHPDTLKAVNLLLSRQGHVVVTASTVEEAKRKLAEPFDLLVSDIGLPDGSGMDVMRFAAAQQPQIRGIALSGYGMEDDVERSRGAGFHEHLTKPVNLTTLRDTITRAAGEIITPVPKHDTPPG